MVKLFISKKIYGLEDEPFSPANFFFVKNGTVAEIGYCKNVESIKGRADEVINFGNRVVVPGFIDAHTHLLQTGLTEIDTDLSEAKSISDVLSILSEDRKKGREDGYLRAYNLEIENIKEERYPTPFELDRVSKEFPIYVKTRDSHSCSVNTKAKELAGKKEGIVRGSDFEDVSLFFHKLLSKEKKIDAYRIGAELAAKNGVTTFHTLIGRDEPEDEELEILMEIMDDLKVDVVPYYQSRNIELVKRFDLKGIGGCLLIDGSISSRTAGLFAPYRDERRNKGMLYFRRKELDRFIAKANGENLQVAMHAIGDRAIEQLLSVYETVLKKNPREDHRHRIEHCELLNDNQIERMARLGICPSMQPAFDFYWGGKGGLYERRLGVKRAKKLNPLKKIINKGLKIAGGSDSPITPLNPLLGIHAAVNHNNKESRLDVGDGLRMFTTYSAYACFREDNVGKLGTGYKADFAVLSEDPFDIPKEQIKDVKIEKVYKEGIRI